MAAPLGNKNAVKAKWYERALKRALAEVADGKLDAEEGLLKVARREVAAALSGEPWAIQSIASRLDGKPAQAVLLSGEEEGSPVRLVING